MSRRRMAYVLMLCISRVQLFVSGQPDKFTCWLPLKQQYKVFSHNNTNIRVSRDRNSCSNVFQQWQNPRKRRTKCKGRRFYCWWGLRQHLLVVTGTYFFIIWSSNSQVHISPASLVGGNMWCGIVDSICLVLCNVLCAHGHMLMGWDDRDRVLDFKSNSPLRFKFILLCPKYCLGE